jgi:menaquinone-dependent protoporphyrinogen oxidase
VKQVLVAFGSKRRGTAGLATMIGDALARAGFTAVVAPAREVGDLAGFDAVIVAGALYANRWHRHARRFVRRHGAALRGLPVWLVSSGPLDDSAARQDIAPTKQVARLIERVGARGHVTFGGYLAPDAKGFPASAMAKNKSGDWRDPEQVRRWVAMIAPELESADGR